MDTGSRAWTGSWTESPDNPSAASAIRAITRAIGAGSACAAEARASLGVQLGSTGRRGRPTAGWQALTDAERQVVPLVAERLSNQEIAERLFVSRRTVETHVSHTLAKLGCTARRDLIVALRDRSRARASGSTLRPP